MDDKEIENLKQEVEGLNKQIENIENKDKKPETVKAPKEELDDSQKAVEMKKKIDEAAKETEKPKDGSKDAATLNFVDFHDPKRTKQTAICKQPSFYNFATKKVGTEENIKDWDKKNQAYKPIDYVSRSGNFIRLYFQ